MYRNLIKATVKEVVAMTIYHLRITQLTMMIIELVITKYDDMIMVVFANGFTAGGKLKPLLLWRTALPDIGYKFGYFIE